MGDYPWRAQLLYATCLCLALLLFFLPLPAGWVAIGCVLTLLVSGYKGWRTHRYARQVKQVSPWLDSLEERLEALPERLRRRLPVILVTGDATQNYFPNGENDRVIVTGKGIWIAVPVMAELALTADALSGRWPEVAGRIGVMFTLSPERHASTRALQGYLQTFRQSWADASRTSGYRLPGYLTVNAELGAPSVEPQWFWWTPSQEGICLLDNAHTELEAWRHQGEGQQSGQRESLAVMLKTLQRWLNENVLDPLGDKQLPVPPWTPGAVACLNAPGGNGESIWRDYLGELTTLALPPVENASAFSLPEPLVSNMPVSCPMAPKKRALCHALMFTALFAAVALCSSAYNNVRLLEHVGGDLLAYHRIPMESYDDKLTSLKVLKADRLLLDKYYREGEPERLGVGLYAGARMIPPLDVAIMAYRPRPPPPPPQIVVEAPKVVRLDSMSLFDTGKAALKPDSTKVLVDALINVKAKPGWLILIAGHTDVTGDAERNQALSLARAEAVRDWMIETSDINKTCFAIQGYGATKPIADNATAEGRAANRRVEISLVPDASACRQTTEHQISQKN